MVAFHFSFFFFFESTWVRHWAPSAVRAAKRTDAAEAELHAGRGGQVGKKQKDNFCEYGVSDEIGK